MINEKKVIADKFIVVDYATYIPVDVFFSLEKALEESFSNINYGVVILDKDGNDITMEYWKEVYYSGR